MSLDGIYDDESAFAKILRQEAPAFRVYEDAGVLAFMDLFPRTCTGDTQGRYRAKYSRHRRRTLLKLTVIVQKVAKAIRKALRPDGVIVAAFNGEAAGQTVYHLHFHVIPCWATSR
jgi:histidine triad (HIT) family protein